LSWIEFLAAKPLHELLLATVCSLCDFRLVRWCSLSIGGWQPSGAASPAIFFLWNAGGAGRGG
jgi:hypothetical protein